MKSDEVIAAFQSLSLEERRQVLQKMAGQTERDAAFAPEPKAEPLAAPPVASWGVRLGPGGHWRGAPTDKNRPEGCPTWAWPQEWHRWEKKGLLVWDDVSQRMAAISVSQALALLETLHTDSSWRVEGIPVVEYSAIGGLPTTPPQESRRKTRKHKSEPGKALTGQPADQAVSNAEMLEQERVRLTGQAAEEFYAFLEAHEADLRNLAEKAEQRRQELLGRVWAMITRQYWAREIDKLDLEGRALRWQRPSTDSSNGPLVCDLPPGRATLHLTGNGFFWEPVLEWPRRFEYFGPWMLSLDAALEWAERKLPALQAEAEAQAQVWELQEAQDQGELAAAARAALSKKKLARFRIDPEALEPARITYRAIIELEHAPSSFKTLPLSFGEKMLYDEQYPSSSELLASLRLNPLGTEVEDRAHGLESWYELRSTAMYYQLSVATAKAQELWDHSDVLAKFRDKQVKQARYGVEEVETGYCTWLGGCEDPVNPWPPDKSREEFLAKRALRLTLLNALDLNGYRAFLGLAKRHCSDEDLLRTMHKSRSRSVELPRKAREESQGWLAAHSEQASETQAKQHRTEPRTRARRGKGNRLDTGKERARSALK
jgi:hypothetical protein